ncbi:MBL fold metallo-hydrolase [Terrabacter sp. GCM10028922]|uniref:MBL fold metallo-hydrolase n=1 Tax=Terrabacter sp. GCM10028922 TaxID=3273428 RepID=UPI0036234E0E
MKGDGMHPHQAAHREQIADGCYAWVQPDGGWGLSNAGLVVGNESSLLVDTLFDLSLTELMLEDFGPLLAEAPIQVVVNTHANGDHWFGNQLLPRAEIVASVAAALEMRRVGPAQLRQLLTSAAPTGPFVRDIFGNFDFDAIDPRYPTRTFTGDLVLEVGGVEVHLIEVGPAHTDGDVIVYVPSARTVFTGDIVFNEGTPIMWAGPVSGWLAALETIAMLDIDTVVPGHGPVAGPQCLEPARRYLERVHAVATAGYNAGRTAISAAREIAEGEPALFRNPPESERLIANVHAIYGELDQDYQVPNPPQLFGCMAELLEA